MNHIEAMRKMIRLFEQDIALPPQVEKYISTNPDVVFNDPKTALAAIKDRYYEDRSHFSWAIASLPDGRCFECSPRFAKQMGLNIIQQGDSMDFD